MNIENDRSLNFSPALQAAILEIIPSSDPIDDPSFSPVDWINVNFPTEQSLVDLDTAIQKIKVKIARTDEETLRAVREQISAGTKGRQELAESKKAIQELFAKINDIKIKAEKSERMVTEICRDIKQLDFAKRNLTTTITAIKRLHMLVTATDQLKSMTTRREYKSAGQLLEAVNQLSEYFSEYNKVPKIAEINTEVESIRNNLQFQINEEYANYVERPSMTSENIVDAYWVVEALGKQFKKQFLMSFSRKLLADYNRQFSVMEESSSLEYVDRRFAWLKRFLKTYNEQHAKLFPANWKFDMLLCEDFIAQTKSHLIVHMEERRKRDDLDVDKVMDALKKTLAFEKDLGEWFGPQVVETPPDAQVDNADEDDADADADEDDEDAEALANPNSAAAIKARWKKFQRERERKALKEQRKNEPRYVMPFKNALATVFEPYLDLYIAREDQKIRAVLDKAIAEETWTADEDESNKVLISSTDLIYYFQTSMKFCLSFTKGQAYFDLHKLFRSHLSSYSKSLLNKLPSRNARLTEREEKLLCLIVNTADYCGTTCTGMEARMKKQIDPRLADAIDFKNEHAEFENVIAQAMKSLVSALETKMEPALSAMIRMPWGSWESVGDQSDYVNQISTYVSQSVPIYRNWLANASHFRFFCDTFVLSFVPLLIQHIFKCRRISEAGVSQLLLDFTAIKTVLVNLPTVEQAPPQAPPPRYIKNVQKELSKADLLLKVIMTSPESVVERYKTLIPEDAQKLDELAKIFELKGLARSEAKPYLDAFASSKQQQQQHPQPTSSPIPGSQALDSTAQKAKEVGDKMKKFFSPMGDVFAKSGSRGGSST